MCLYIRTSEQAAARHALWLARNAQSYAALFRSQTYDAYYLCSRIHLPETTGQRRLRSCGDAEKEKKKEKKSRDESLHGGVFSCKECLVEEQKARDPPRSGCKEHSSRQRSPNSFPDGKINVTAAARPHQSGSGKRGVFVLVQVPELKCAHAPGHSTFTPPSNERLAPRISAPNLGPARAINGTRSGPRCQPCVYVFAPRLKSRLELFLHPAKETSSKEKRKMAGDDADYTPGKKEQSLFHSAPRFDFVGLSPAARCYWHILSPLTRPPSSLRTLYLHPFLSFSLSFFPSAVSRSSCDPRGKVFLALGSAMSRRGARRPTIPQKV